MLLHCVLPILKLTPPIIPAPPPATPSPLHLDISNASVAANTRVRAVVCRACRQLARKVHVHSMLSMPAVRRPGGTMLER